MVKRGLDVLVSAGLLALLSPVFLLIAFAIWITSPGPILFRQVRMGRDFRTFEILKFRTMVHAQSGLAYTFGADPRITPVGRLLRQSKLDELPQLWNVLRGEMSLVGPRPVLPELTWEFRDEYEQLLRVRPGLTDPASVKYCQEAALLGMTADPMHFFKTVVTPDKIRLSLAYLKHASLASDFAVLAMTAFVCCVPALSRRYGQVPPALLPHQNGSSRGAVARVDGCLFTRDGVAGEMFEEELAEFSSELEGAPWIPPSRAAPVQHSTLSAAKSGASRL